MNCRITKCFLRAKREREVIDVIDGKDVIERERGVIDVIDGKDVIEREREIRNPAVQKVTNQQLLFECSVDLYLTPFGSILHHVLTINPDVHSPLEPPSLCVCITAPFSEPPSLCVCASWRPSQSPLYCPQKHSSA